MNRLGSVLFALLLLIVPFSAEAEAPEPAPADGPPAEAATRAAGALQAAAESAAFLGAPKDTGPRAEKSFSNVDLSLFTDRPSAVPGETIRAALRFDIDENWHVYDGRNPGGIGLPTTVEWTLPAGFVATAGGWPAPEVYEETSGDTSYVHHDNLTLTAEIAVPADASGSFELVADYDFQFCYNKCIRKAGQIKTSVPIGAVADPELAKTMAAPFAAADARVAATSDDAIGAASHTALLPETAVALVVEVRGDTALVELEEEAHRPTIVFDRIDGVDVDVLETREVDGAIRVLARATPAKDFDPTVSAATFGATVQVAAKDDPKTVRSYRVPLALTLAAAGGERSANDDPLLTTVDVAAVVDAPVDAEPVVAAAPEPESIPLWQALFFAFLGGLILNIMPCVLPVLSLKALALVEEANHSEHNLGAFVGMYVLGVLVSFWALAGVVIGVQMSGELVGWGFQFQEPGYVLVMTAVIFGFALSLFGVFEIPGLTVSGNRASGLRGSFIHGALTTALSTPCSAPLLGSALTFALAQSPSFILLSFTLIGAGLAAPVSILTMTPAMRRFIPKPGAWMETFKHVVAFLLVGTAIWLLSVLNAQLVEDAMTTVFIMLGLVALAAWIVGRFTGPLASSRRRLLALSAAAIVLLGGIRFLSLEIKPFDPDADLSSELIAWKAFEGEDSLALAAEGNTLFIDFTADWCATCKTIEAAAIETDAVSSLIRENGIVPLKADLTRKNPELSQWVEHYGRSAIPLYVIIPAGSPDSPVVLPEVITEEMLLEELRKAGPSAGNGEITARNDEG